MLESGEGVIEEKFFCVPFGFGEKVGDGLSGASVAEEFCHFGEAFSSGEGGDGDDGSPEVGEVAAADEFSDAFEKPLAEGGGKRCILTIGHLLWLRFPLGNFLQTNHSEMSAFYARTTQKMKGLLQFEK